MWHTRLHLERCTVDCVPVFEGDLLPGVVECCSALRVSQYLDAVVRVAVCYSFLQRVAACCSVSCTTAPRTLHLRLCSGFRGRSVSRCCSVLQRVVCAAISMCSCACCSVLQFVAVCCNVLQRAAACCSVP